MSYVSEISNALGARGNALAQGELQRGQVYGNLAQNLGQIPFQALAFDQQRQAALQNNELKKLALEKAQRNAEADKEAVRIVHSGAPDEQILMELERVYSGDPDKFLAIQNLKSQHLLRQQQIEHQQRMEEHQNLQDQISFHNAQGGGPGVPMPLPTPTGQDLSGNALSPIVPQAQPNIPMPQVNPPLKTKFGVLPGKPTAAEQLVTKREQTAEDIKNKEHLLAYGAGLKPPEKEPAAQHVAARDKSSSTGWVWAIYNPTKRDYDKTTTEAPPPASIMAGIPAGTFAGVQGGIPQAYVPEKGGPGKLAAIKGYDTTKGPLQTKTLPAAIETRIKAANDSIKTGTELIGMIDDPEVAAKLGPVMGRATDLEELIGVIPSEMTELKGALQSWADLQPGVHQMRSSQMSEKIKHEMPRKLTPESLKGFIRGYLRTAKNVASDTGREAPGASPAAAPGGIKVKRKSDGKVTTVPAEAWNGLTPEQQGLYERQ